MEKKETSRMQTQLKQVATKGLQLDMVQTYFSSISWVTFQVFQVLCLGFTGCLAVRGKITVGLDLLSLVGNRLRGFLLPLELGLVVLVGGLHERLVGLMVRVQAHQVHHVHRGDLHLGRADSGNRKYHAG